MAKTHSKRSDTIIRWILAGPVAILVAYVSMAVMPLWLPEGRGGVDHLVMPVLLFPVIWSVVFFYACLTEKPRKAALVLFVVFLLSLGIAAWSLFGG